MKITIKTDKLISDSAFKNCTAGAIYEAEMCENPMTQLFAQMGIELSEEDLCHIKLEEPQCLRFRDDKGEFVYCTFEESVIVKPEHY